MMKLLTTLLPLLWIIDSWSITSVSKGEVYVVRKQNRSSKKKISAKTPNYLGQHFLHNRKVINKMIDHANLSKNDLVVEFGAGKGALTQPLSLKAGQIFAVEYDPQHVNLLKADFSHSDHVRIIQQDILKFSLPKAPFKLVANIPYAITTPIFEMVLNPFTRLQNGMIIIEKGAAKRFTGTFIKDGYLLVWRMWYQLKYVETISKYYFSPAPKVDSAMLKIIRRKVPLISKQDYHDFVKLVNFTFKHPYQDIIDVLKTIFTHTQLKKLRKNLLIKDSLPVGAVTEEQWALIFTTMKQYVPEQRWPREKQKKRTR